VEREANGLGIDLDVAPDLCAEAVAGDHLLTMADEIEQNIQRLRLDWNGLAPPEQASRVRMQLEVPEAIDDPGTVLGLLHPLLDERDQTLDYGTNRRDPVLRDDAI
jgi:hypothetical protein